MFGLSVRHRRILGAVLALSVVTGLSACAPAARNPDGDLSGVTLTIGDQVNSLKTVVEAAGVLTGAPYTVTWAEFQAAAPLFQAMRSDSVDTGHAADLPTLTAIGGGLPIRPVAAMRLSGANAGIVVQGDSTVRTVADLKGREVAVSSARGSVAEYLLAKVLTDAGLSFTDVKVTYLLPSDAQAAFSTHKIEIWAIFGIYKSAAIDKGAREIVDGRDGRTSGVGFISASASSLANPAKKRAIADFLSRVARAYAWATANQADYAKAFAERNRVELAVAKVVVEQGPYALTPVTAEVVALAQSVADLAHDIGSLPSAIQVAPVVDASVFTAAAPTVSTTRTP